MSEIRYFTDGEQATAAVLNRPSKDLELVDSVMSKVQFEANAAARREQYADNGVVDWGFSLSNPSDYGNIGGKLSMWTWPNRIAKGTLELGGYSDQGNSTKFNIAGSIITAKYIANTSYERVSIKIPEGPLPKNITDTTNIPGIDRGNFGILVNDNRDWIISQENRTFETSVGDWIAYNSSAYKTEVSYNDTEKRARITQNGETDDNIYGAIIQLYNNISLIAGVRYKLEYDFYGFDDTNGNNSIWIRRDNNITNGVEGITPTLNEETGKYELEFDVDISTTDGIIMIRGYNYYGEHIDEWFEIDNVSLKIVEDKNIIVSLKDTEAGSDINDVAENFVLSNSVSRQDLVFIEAWDENISDRNMVYPYGNVQYTGGNTDNLNNIAKGTFDGYDTYSLFGEWQEVGNLIGYGYKWDDLTLVQKIQFSKNPENNVYKDGTEWYQKRFKIRVVKGIDNDWKENTHLFVGKPTSVHKGGAWDIYSEYKDTFSGEAIMSGKIITNGKMETIYDYGTYDSIIGAFFLKKTIDTPTTDSEFFIFSDRTRGNKIPSRVVPIALVQRRNAGIWHDVFNPEGTAKVYVDGSALYSWETNIINSLEDCFDEAMIAAINPDTLEVSRLSSNTDGHVSTGSIASGVAGRPDGLYYDCVNDKDVKDLRMSSTVKPLSEIIEEYTRQFKNAEMRGEEQQFNIKQDGELYWLSSAWDSNKKDGGIYLHKDSDDNGIHDGLQKDLFMNNIITGLWNEYKEYYVQWFDINKKSLGFSEIKEVSDYDKLYGDDVQPSNAVAVKFFLKDKKTYTYNNTLTHCDIIGDPRKLSDRVKYTVVDGTSQTVDLLLNDYVLNDDGHIYRALVSRDGIDLDTDDYTNTDKWIDLGTDGSIGGYPQEWLDNGVLGNPLVMVEDKSALPIDSLYDDVRITQKLKKKLIGFYKILVSAKDGSWIEYSLFNNSDLEYGYMYDTTYNTIKININNSYNSMGYSSEQEMLDLMIVKVYYLTYTNILISDYNRDVKSIIDYASIEGDTQSSNNPISIVTQSLINKVNESTNDQAYGLKFHNIGFYLSSGQRRLSDNYGVPTTFDNADDLVSFDAAQVTNSPQVKYFIYLSESNNRLTFHSVFRELKYDSGIGSWGDDNQIRIASNLRTLTDLNGNKIQNGQKAVNLPYFIGDN